MERIKNLAKIFFGVPLTLISFYFLFKLISSQWNQISEKLATINFIGVFFGLLFFLLFYLFRTLAWIKLLENEGFKTPLFQSAYLLSASEIKRYIPGSIMGFIARINSFLKIKVPVKNTVKLIFYESIIFVSSSALLSTPALFLFAKSSEFFPALLVLLFILLILATFGKRSKFITILLKYKDPFALMLWAWAFFGLGSYLTGVSVYYLDPYKIVQIISIFILSWLAGYITLFVPLGLGVREAVVTLTLSFFVPAPIAATIAVMSRIISVAAEMIFLLLTYFFNKFAFLFKKINYLSVTLWSAVIAYITYFSYFSFEKYNNFFTGRFDLGNMDQTVWNSLHGRFFLLTNPDSTQIVSRLAYHADFILLLLTPFYLLWNDPRMLLLVQSAILGFGAYFIYKICESLSLNKALALVFSVSFLLNPFVQKQNLFDFHAVTLSTTILLASYYFILEKKYLPAFISLILAGLTKEEVWIIVGIMSLVIFGKTKKIKWLVFSILSFASFYLLVTIIIPHVRGSHHFATEYFQDFGDSPSSIMKNMALNPIKTSANLLTFSNLSYFFKLLEPAGFLSLLSPFYLIFALPDLVINTLSKNENLKSLTFHYAATIIPFVYISAIYGARKFTNKFKWAKRIIVWYILIFSLISTYFLGTLPGSKEPSLEIYTNSLSDRDRIQAFLAHIPKKLTVAASNNLGSHLSHRENIYTIPNGMDKADVIVFLLNDNFAQPSLVEQKRLAKELRINPNYIELLEIGDFIAFSKIDKAKYIRPYNL